MPTPTVINKYRYSDVISRRYWDKYFFSSMSINPVISQVGGGAAAGANTETDVWTDGKSIFEYYNIVGNTNLGPKLDGSFGLNLAPDATATHAVEYNTGVTPQNNFTFLIDNTGNTTPAFFLKAQLNVATALGATGPTILMGFRKLQANAAAMATYTDFASIGIEAGKFQVETQLATAGVVKTDTTQVPANATMFQLTVLVDAFGNVTYQINGQPPTVIPATPYQFANSLTVMPFLRILQNATTTATASCNYFECGFQS
jgi:hypothetical protein